MVTNAHFRLKFTLKNTIKKSPSFKQTFQLSHSKEPVCNQAPGMNNFKPPYRQMYGTAWSAKRIIYTY